MKRPIQVKKISISINRFFTVLTTKKPCPSGQGFAFSYFVLSGILHSGGSSLHPGSLWAFIPFFHKKKDFITLIKIIHGDILKR